MHNALYVVVSQCHVVCNSMLVDVSQCNVERNLIVLLHGVCVLNSRSAGQTSHHAGVHASINISCFNMPTLLITWDTKTTHQCGMTGSIVITYIAIWLYMLLISAGSFHAFPTGCLLFPRFVTTHHSPCCILDLLLMTNVDWAKAFGICINCICLPILR